MSALERLQDEPTADLDDESGAEILDLLSTLHAAGRTIVFSTKRPEVAARARRVVHLAEGRIGPGTPVPPPVTRGGGTDRAVDIG